MIDRGDIRQAIDRCTTIWLHHAGYGQFEHKADSLIAKFKEAGGTVREIYVWARVTIIPPAICITVCSSWAVNHYRDNAITYKAQRDKNARELKLANAAITDMQMRQRDVAALDAKYTKELADAKAENDALRDDVAAGRRRLHYRAAPVVMREAIDSLPRCCTQPPPTGRHRWTGLFHPQREGWSLQKQLEEPEAVLMTG